MVTIFYVQCVLPIVILFLHCAIFSLQSASDTFTSKGYSGGPDYAQAVSNFISDIISNHFNECTLVIVESGHDSLNKNHSLLSDAFFFNSELLNPPKILFDLSNLTRTDISEKNYIQNQLASICKLVLTLPIRSEETTRFSAAFINRLTPPYHELVKRDEDHFIFFAENEEKAVRLYSTDISSHLRYKITLCPSERRSTNIPPFMILSWCIYCQEHNKLRYEQSNSSDRISMIFPDFTTNFHQHVIRVTGPSKYNSTFEITAVDGGGYAQKRGVVNLVFLTVANKLNMSVQVRPCLRFGKFPEGTSGILLKNGTWAGCVGDVLRNDSDMGLSISPDEKRFSHVHFCNPLEYSYVSFVTEKGRVVYSWKTVFIAVGPLSWFLILISLIITVYCISIMEHHSSYRIVSSSRKEAVVKMGLEFFGYLIGQEFSVPTSLSAQFLSVIWLYYGFTVSAIYLCSLQALIVSPSVEFVPRTFSELVNSNSYYGWGAPSGFRNGLGEELFKHSNNQIMQGIYRKMEGDPDELSCTKRALRDYACFNWDIMEQFHLWTRFADRSGKHPFLTSTETTFFVSLNFITRKREIYREHFNNFNKRQYDSGLVKQTLQMDWRLYRIGLMKKMASERKPDSDLSSGNSADEDGPRPFGLSTVKGSFFVLFSGIGASILALMAEKCLRKRL